MEIFTIWMVDLYRKMLVEPALEEGEIWLLRSQISASGVAVDMRNEELITGYHIRIEGQGLPYLGDISMMEFKIPVDGLNIESEGVSLSVIFQISISTRT